MNMNAEYQAALKEKYPYAIQMTRAGCVLVLISFLFGLSGELSSEYQAFLGSPEEVKEISNIGFCFFFSLMGCMLVWMSCQLMSLNSEREAQGIEVFKAEKYIYATTFEYAAARRRCYRNMAVGVFLILFGLWMFSIVF